MVEAPAAAPAYMLTITESIGVAEASLPAASQVVALAETVGVVESVGVMPVAFDTPLGGSVSTSPPDPATNTSPAKVTFEKVVGPGYTTVSNLVAAPPPPTGFESGNPAVAIDLSTTAQFAGSAEVCVSYGGSTFSNARSVRLFHYEQDGWVDRTTGANPATKQVCGTVKSFSPFAVFAAKDAVVGRMVGAATIAAPSSKATLTFQISEGAPSAEERLQYVAVRTGSSTSAAIVDRFESTSIDWVVFSDNPDIMLRSRVDADTVLFAGTGKWNGLAGYTFDARALDTGSATQKDEVSLIIRAPSGNMVTSVIADVNAGNIRSFRMRR